MKISTYGSGRCSYLRLTGHHAPLMTLSMSSMFAVSSQSGCCIICRTVSPPSRTHLYISPGRWVHISLAHVFHARILSFSSLHAMRCASVSKDIPEILRSSDGPVLFRSCSCTLDGRAPSPSSSRTRSQAAYDCCWIFLGHLRTAAAAVADRSLPCAHLCT